jgi:[ribosomal protein S5]-alanine N-acetyltransferase
MAEILFQSARLSYAKLGVSHATPEYLSWLNDPEVQSFIISVAGTKQTMADLERYLQKLPSNEHNFAIYFEQRHVGNIKVHSVDSRNERAEIGYLIGDKSVRGKGIGTEAVGRIVQFCFETLGLHKVTAGCDVSNIGSIKILEKNGFTKEGTYREHYKIGQSFIDAHRYGIIKK